MGFLSSQNASKTLSEPSDQRLERENSQRAEFRYARPGSHGFSEPSVMKEFFDDTEERKDPKSTIGYIGRYARRPPLSEIRMKDYISDMIAFKYQDYRHGGSKVLHTL